MTSYSAAMIDSIDATSVGRAEGAAVPAVDEGVVVGRCGSALGSGAARHATYISITLRTRHFVMITRSGSAVLRSAGGPRDERSPAGHRARARERAPANNSGGRLHIVRRGD